MIYEDIAPLLTANGFGSFGADFFWGNMPDAPAELLTFYESPGPQGEYAKDGPAGTEGRLQALSRAEDYAPAMQKALEVYAFLDDLRVTVSGTRYHFRALGRPFDLGATDEQGRTLISTNYALTIRET